MASQAPEDARRELRAYIDGLSPEERDALRQEAAEAVMKQRRVKVGDKVMSLKQLRDRVLRMKEEFERGVYDEGIRTVPRWALQKATPSSSLRPGAEKQLLRQEDEERLELDRIGQGVVYSPSSNPLDSALRRLNPLHKRDFAWGIFARPARCEQVLRDAWAGRAPEEVLDGGAFYHDIVRACHAMELTLMVRTSRTLPLAPLRQQLAVQLKEGVAAVSLPGNEEADVADLQRFIRLWEDERLAKATWVDKGAVKEGTHLVLSATPRGLLTVEAISPGSLKDRTTSVVGTNSNHAVTAAVFGLFLGPKALDPLGRKSVGNGMLWAANGGRFRPEQGMGTPAVEGPDGRLRFEPPKVEELPASTSLFRLPPSEGSGRGLLLCDIQAALGGQGA